MTNFNLGAPKSGGNAGGRLQQPGLFLGAGIAFSFGHFGYR